MKNYELTVLFHPDLEMNLEPAVNKVKKVLTQNGAKITKEENDGKKRLAYTIGSNAFAVYYYINLELPPEAPLKISSVLNITDEVIRYLLVRVDERKAKLDSHNDAKNDKDSSEGKEEVKESKEEIKEEKENK